MFLDGDDMLNNLLQNELYGELFSDDLEEDSDGELDRLITEERLPSVRTVRAYYSQADREDSVFWKKYIAPAVGDDCPLRDQESCEGVIFRRRFRVPYTVFDFLVEDIKRVHELPTVKLTASRTPGVDIRLLVLGSLRILASGCAFDLIEELTAVAEETLRRFFHDKFCRWGDLQSSIYIKMPHDQESMERVARQYEECGLPGCAASVDCVHLVWDRCRASVRSLCLNGKEKCPTLVFQVAGSHTRRVLHVSQYFWGTLNDKTIARIDKLFNLFREDGSFLKNWRWKR